MNRKKSVVGLVAHVDAGKTTLSEALLYASGALRRQGRVDHGDTWLDTDAQEKERGITIFSKQALFSYRDTDFTLLDTPGHADFSGETERAVWVMDMAILVISASDGVQSHTRTLWQVLSKARVPVIVFVNKIDQPGFDRSGILAGLRADLGGSFVDIAAPDAAEDIATFGEEALDEYLAEGSVRPETARQLFLTDQVSISRLEKFAACPYRHFIDYGLRPVQRETFTFENSDAGTFFHAALDGYMRRAAAEPEWPALSRRGR